MIISFTFKSRVGLKIIANKICVIMMLLSDFFMFYFHTWGGTVYYG
jgi:hypothetical protein